MQKNTNNILSLASALGLVITASTGLAGTKTWDFSTNPTADTTLTIGGNNDTIWQANTGNPDGFLALTYSVGSQNAVVVFPDIDPGKVVTGFQFDCDMRIGNPQSARAADGFSVNFARAGDPILDSPIIDNAASNGQPENGTGTGIAIGFDTWSGNTLPDGSADIEGIIVMVDKVVVLKQEMPTRNGSADDETSMQTGPRDNTFWDVTHVNDAAEATVYQSTDAWKGLAWRKLSVIMDVSGKLTVKWKGKTILDSYQTSYFPSAGRVVLMGRTGGSNENTHFDNITLTTTATSDAIPPADITGFQAVEVGAGHVSLKWNATTDLPDATSRVVYTVQKDGTNIFSNLQATNVVDFAVLPGKAFTYRVKATDLAANDTAWSTITATTPADEPSVGIIKAEVYHGIENTDVGSLINAGNFPNSPDQVTYSEGIRLGNQNNGVITSLGDNYGARMTGTITPIQSGSYNFFIKSDDASAFYLNTAGAAIPDPTSATAICEETDCCDAFLEPGDASLNEDTTTHSTSSAISLTAGKAYGFTVLLKEGGGGDGVAVAWRISTDTTPAANLSPIEGVVLAGQQDKVGASISITQNPEAATVIANEPVTFKSAALAVSAYGTNAQYQWYKNGSPIAFAQSATYTIPVTSTADNGAKFSVKAMGYGVSATSTEATLTVQADTKLPTVFSAESDEPATSVLVKFSEPVTTPSSTTAANYTLDNGGTVTAASVVDQYTVKLTTAKLTPGTKYTLTVTGVKDNAGNDSNSKFVFASWGLVPNRVKFEQWTGVSGTLLGDLLGSADYATAPDVTKYLNTGLTVGSPSGNSGWNESFGDNYGARITGFLIPTETASYNFFIRSDDASALYLSTDENFINVTSETTPTCQEVECCAAFLEVASSVNGDGTTYSTTQTPISLTAGKKYAVTVILKEGTGGDGVGVAMLKAGSTNAAADLAPISSLIYYYGPPAATNILSKSDKIVASSANTPPSGSENAPNVLDGDSGTKYLNFDKLNTGFTVTPALGATVITGIQLTTGNDEEPRDPASYVVEGSVDGTTFETIASGSITHVAARKTVQSAITFANTKPFLVYRVTFPTVFKEASANSMQVADVALLGNVYGGSLGTIPSTKPALSVVRSSGSIVITFEGSLQSLDKIGGTWTDVTGSSPLTVTPSASAMFYRAKK